jgi:hypothetical protein
MGTRVGGSALLWSRGRAGERLAAIQVEIRQILHDYPDLHGTRPIRDARVEPQSTRSKDRTRLVPRLLH